MTKFKAGQHVRDGVGDIYKVEGYVNVDTVKVRAPNPQGYELLDEALLEEVIVASYKQLEQGLYSDSTAWESGAPMNTDPYLLWEYLKGIR